MAATKAHMRATQKYEANNYDKILLRIRKDGEITREKIQQAADAAGISLNAYILAAVYEKIQKAAGPEDQKNITDDNKYY